ncbi:hypothetical protein SISSUDRAFT_1041554 [Sistotremastrum suecicum HHB10207 ss-3]|uniref:Uncharacterized protein n=1 Tax=Sistotremastrum suecicum HHB10207 ss-3 TaxID=1314776 RepID=A0A166H2T6_9AGAM|nr:hypothetical protein SISSUDRAFT_1041554 [Sistotremastrum suecicum HHB10207 ss-3]
MGCFGIKGSCQIVRILIEKHGNVHSRFQFGRVAVFLVLPLTETGVKRPAIDPALALRV